MPTSKFIVPQFNGLFTNNNVLFNGADPYYTNVTSAYSDGTGMVVANNIVLSRPNIIEPRHAFASVKVTTYNGSTQYNPANQSSAFCGLYEWNQYGLTNYIIPSTLGAFGQLYGNYANTEIEGFVYKPSTLSGSAPNFSVSANWNYPNFFEGRDQVFITAANGVWRIQGNPNTPQLYESCSQANTPFLASATFSTGTTAGINWLDFGNETYFICIPKRMVSSTQYVYGRNTPPIYVRNWTSPAGISVTVSAAPGTYLAVGDIIEVYRTSQLPIGSGITSFSSMALAARLTVTTLSASISIPLLGSDETLAAPGTPTLAAIINQDATGAVLFPGVTMPIANSAINFQGYTWFANFSTVNYGALQIIEMPSDGDSLQIATDTSATNLKTLTFKNSPSAGQVQIPANAASFSNTAAGLSYEGLSSSAVPVNIPTQDSPPLFYPDAVAEFVSGDIGGTTSVGTFTGTGVGIISANFPPTNGLVWVQDNSDNSYCFFSYATADFTTTPGSVIFTGTSTASGLSSGLSITATYHLFVIDGNSLQGIPLYYGATNLCPLVGTSNAIYPNASAFQYGAWTVSGSKMHTYVNAVGLNALPQSALFQQLAINMAAVCNSISEVFFLDPLISDPRQFTVETCSMIWPGVRMNATNPACWSPTLSTSAYTLLSSNPITQNGLCSSSINLPNQVNRALYLAPQTIGDPSKQIMALACNTNDMFIFKQNEGTYRLDVTPGSIYPTISNITLLDNTVWLAAPQSVQQFNQSVYFLAQTGIYSLTSTGLTEISEIIDNFVQTLIANVSLQNVRSFHNQFRNQYGLYFPAVNADGSGVCLVYDYIRNNFYTWNDINFQAAITTARNRMLFVTTDLEVQPYYTTGTYTTSSDTCVLAASDFFPFVSGIRLIQFTTSVPNNIAPGTYYYAVGTASTSSVQVFATLNSAQNLVSPIAVGGSPTGSIVIYPDNSNYLKSVSYQSGGTSWQYLRYEYFTGVNDSPIITNTAAQVVDVLGNAVVSETSALNQPNAPIDQVEYQSLPFSSGTIISNTAGAIQVYYKYLVPNDTPYAPFDDIVDLLPFLGATKQLYAYCQTNLYNVPTPVQVSLVNIESNNFSAGTYSSDNPAGIVVQFPSNVNSVVPNPATDQILLGVNTDIQLRPFHANNPQLNKRFSEVAFTTQDFPSSNIQTSFMVDNMQDWSDVTVFQVLPTNNEIYRALIPIQASRGRFLQCRFQHSTPMERFAVNSMAIVYTQTASTNTTKAH